MRGIRAFCKPQLLPKLLESLLLDDLPPDVVPVVTEHQHTVDADTVGATEVPPGGRKPAAAVPLSADAARVPLARILLHIVGELSLQWHIAGDLDACASERAPHDWYVMLPVSQREQPVYTLMALSRYRDALIQSCGSKRLVMYQPLIPQILTASYHCILLPPRTFDVHAPVTRDVFYAVALLLQLHTHCATSWRRLASFHPRLDAQATFAKLFADIGRIRTMPRLMSCSRTGCRLHLLSAMFKPCGQICELKPSPVLQSSRLTLPS